MPLAHSLGYVLTPLWVSCGRGMGGFVLRHGSKYNGIDAADQGWAFPPLREGTPALHRDLQIPAVLTGEKARIISNNRA